jgi:isopentenyl phosphate kinase
MILIKFGGSVITDKSRYRTFNADRVKRLCKESRDSGEKVIVVHGAGSFGHVLAKENNLNDGFKNESQIPAVAQVCYDMRDLNGMIVKELNDAGLPAVSVPTGSCFMMKNRELIINDPAVLKSMFDKGIMPVMFGDVVMDTELGFAICSGDQIMERLKEIFEPSRVIFVSDIDGLYDKDPKNNKDAKLIENVDRDVLKSVETDITVADVTGGVRGKMETMLRMCSEGCDCVLVNGTVEGRLLTLLKGGKVPCTIARGE